MTVKELHRAPSLAKLYPRAVLGGLRKAGGETLPDTEYVYAGVSADPGHVAAYNRICGFRLTDELPVTYPHILAFPLQVALLSEPEFPFPLLGMVHVANRITLHRPLRLGEELTLRVRAERLRTHDKGTEFDVVTEVVTGGETVWTDVSTYLRRGAGAGSGGGKTSLAPPSAGAIWWVPGDIGRRYAEVSGDRNPIHLHPLTARMFGFRGAIAHGMWTKARCLAAFEGRLPGAYTVDVRFKLPVLLPSRVGFTSWRADAGWAFELWHASRPKPHLAGTITTP
ncbi:MaoC/PaaZ C-terminal domain-containing protein [Saccharomonospora sp. NPDC046836]|uniref:MaoC/PaaZ C-terminal domain-containing protein n=1 Tax=Saccharomonospora sp. NPDC046836 TaxID=3156921 RepID=UPI0033D2D1E2